VSVCGLVDRGSALQRRLNEREKEMETDERDRQKEREELEDIRRKLLEEGHPDPEAEMERVRSILLTLILICSSSFHHSYHLSTVEHILFSCVDFDVIRQNFYPASDLKDLFQIFS